MFDIAIIGIGPAGLKAIELGLKNNLKIIAFEKQEVGGTCLNLGCIPTKSIVHCANLFKEMNSCSKVGLNAKEINFNWQEILNRKSNIISKFTKPLRQNLSKNITLINANAQIKIENGKPLIIANNQTFEAKNIIIATGTRPFELPNLKYDNDFIINSDDIFNLETLPNKITIVGSGAIGLEWANILSNFNVDVTILEKEENLSPASDIDIQKRIERILKLNKIKYFKGTTIEKIENKTLKLSNSTDIETDKILVCVGRKSVLPKITNPENKEIQLKINDDFSTNLNNIYAIGDITKKTMLAHSASYQAKQVLNSILGHKKLEEKLIPSVIYINPELAQIGVREQDIKNNENYKIKKMLLGANAKSWCDEANDGFIKVILKDDLIVGACVASKDADSIITIINIFIDKKIKVDEISEMIFPHPSLAEIVQEVLING